MVKAKQQESVKIDDEERGYIATLAAQEQSAQRSKQEFFRFLLHKYKVQGAGWEYDPAAGELIKNGKK